MTYSVVPDKSVGDIFTEVMWDTYIRDNQNKGLMRPVAEVTLSFAQGSISFTSIAADWNALILVWYARGDNLVATKSAFARFNGDSGANYDRVWYKTSGSNSWATTETLATDSIYIGDFPGTSAGSNVFGGGIITVFNYTAVVGHKALTALNSCKVGTASGNVTAGQFYGVWRNTAAINRIDLNPDNNNFAAGSRFTLYGI